MKRMTEENRAEEVFRNKFINDRYVSVFEHQGLDICTLEVANPIDGDKLGYAIDFVQFEGDNYDILQDAIENIDREYIPGDAEELSEDALAILKDLASTKNENEFELLLGYYRNKK